MKSRKALVYGVLVIFGLAAGASAQQKPSFKMPRAADLTSHLALMPNGEFVVSVWAGGKWKEAGSLEYDRFVKEKSLDLAPLLAGADEARIRITQRGGGAAHIDSVRLGGHPPASVSGAEAERPSSKLALPDHDVLDAAGRSFEISFPGGRSDAVLMLTARVEGIKIPSASFRFPASNASETSKFYSYRMGSVSPPPMDGGEPWRAAMACDPFFKEFCSTSSGHPDGFTGGWVSNDEDSLYITLDFTPDNTCDGDKDYAAVHVRCGGDVKEFRVSESETRWGTAHFTYTDGAAYEHKVYEFVIPRSELGDAGSEGHVRLAFSAYGTAASSEPSSRIAYCPAANQYLLAASLVGSGDEDIFGFFLDDQGTVLGSVNICTTGGSQLSPDVAYDAASGRFLVVWQHSDESEPQLCTDIFGQLVNGDGSLYGGNFAIATDYICQYNPAVANDSVNGRFFVVWQQNYWADSGVDILGMFVDAEGRLLGRTAADRVADGSRRGQALQAGRANGDDYFFICDDVGDQVNPDVAFNADLGKYLVVFQTEKGGEFSRASTQSSAQNGEESLIGGKFVEDDGETPDGSTYYFVIASPYQAARYPAVAADPVNGRYLVVWQDMIEEDPAQAGPAAQSLNGGADEIFGRLVDGEEKLIPEEDNLPISTATFGNVRPAVAFDSVNENYLVVWRGYGDWNGSFYPDVIYGQLVPADGDLDPDEPDEILADMNITHDVAPCLDFNSQCANFLVAWVLATHEIYSVVYGPPCQAGPDVPTVVTNPVTNISSTTATGGGNVTSDGGAAVTARGVCWSAAGTPTLGDPHTANGTGVGSFVSQLSGLSPNTSYSVRAYAVNSAGAGYGQTVGFTTLRQYTVTFIAGSGGALSGQTVQYVPEGGSCTAVAAAADPGYFFVNWTGTGGFAATTANPLIVTDVRQDMTVTAHFGSLGLSVERREESAWIVSRYYAHLTITPSGLEGASGVRFVISRKKAAGAYEAIREFTAADLEDGRYVYDDAFIEGGVSYTYKVTVYAADGSLLGGSLEITL
ncbi:MAG: fibronectin type III domain-containing protein [Candidatus Aminicenantes bacterium]|nr:fibronectin type III domain-containing protein [Candidatus Aminicenantes bacterium]